MIRKCRVGHYFCKIFRENRTVSYIWYGKSKVWNMKKNVLFSIRMQVPTENGTKELAEALAT